MRSLGKLFRHKAMTRICSIRDCRYQCALLRVSCDAHSVLLAGFWKRHRPMSESQLRALPSVRRILSVFSGTQSVGSYSAMSASDPLPLRHVVANDRRDAHAPGDWLPSRGLQAPKPKRNKTQASSQSNANPSNDRFIRRKYELQEDKRPQHLDLQKETQARQRPENERFVVVDPFRDAGLFEAEELYAALTDQYGEYE